MAVPKYHHQFLDLHAIDINEPENGSSATSDNSELTPGFVSDQDDAVDGTGIGGAEDVEFMNAVLPVTLRRINEVRDKRAQKNSVLAD